MSLLFEKTENILKIIPNHIIDVNIKVTIKKHIYTRFGYEEIVQMSITNSQDIRNYTITSCLKQIEHLRIIVLLWRLNYNIRYN